MFSVYNTPAPSFIIIAFFILGNNKANHNTLNEFEYQPDFITDVAALFEKSITSNSTDGSNHVDSQVITLRKLAHAIYRDFFHL